MHTKIFILLILITTSVFYACKTPSIVIPEESVVEENPKIVFITYQISETPLGEKTMTFVNQKIVNGKLKKNSIQSVENGENGDLICLQFDEQSNIISRSLIKNPLVKHMEFINEDENLQTKTLKQKTTTFTERFALKNNTKHITISNFSDKKNLITTKIISE